MIKNIILLIALITLVSMIEDSDGKECVNNISLECEVKQ